MLPFLSIATDGTSVSTLLSRMLSVHVPHLYSKSETSVVAPDRTTEYTEAIVSPFIPESIEDFDMLVCENVAAGLIVMLDTRDPRVDCCSMRVCHCNIRYWISNRCLSSCWTDS